MCSHTLRSKGQDHWHAHFEPTVYRLWLQENILHFFIATCRARHRCAGVLLAVNTPSVPFAKAKSMPTTCTT